jgi:hypothetical protein
MQVQKIKKGDEVNFLRPMTNIKTYGTVIDITKDGKYLNIRNSIGDLDFIETSKVELGGKPYKGFALGGRIVNKKFNWVGETFTVKKLEKGKVYTTSGRIFNANVLEDADVKFEKDPNYKPIKRPLYGEAKEIAKDKYYDMLQELKDLKAERKQLFMDMEYEAGIYDKEFTDTDANRYGVEFNRLDDRIEYLEIKTKELEERIYNYEEGGDLESFSDNQRMVMNQNVEIEHHHEELEDILEEKTPVPAWVVAKMETATQNLSDITHYLDGQKELKEDEYEEDNEEEIEVVEPIIVNQGSKTEISKNFIDEAWYNFRGFLKGIVDIDLRDDYTFDYKGEQFEIEPIINSDDKGVSNAVFSIFDGDGEEVGDVSYSREGGKQKFTANSEFFDWNNIKFEDGGFMNNIYDDGGSIKENEVYIKYLNKNKNFKEDIKYFKTYEDAVKWAKNNFERFNPDIIRYTYAKGGGITVKNGRSYPLGKNWTNDHYHVNKSEKHEVDYYKKKSLNYGGHLEAHGLKLGDKIIKTIGSYQKVQNKEGNIVYVDLATGYRNTKEPLPFNNGGNVGKASSEPRIMIMNKYIDKFGTHYGVNLYLLNVKINKSNEEQVQKYIDEGLSPFEIYEKLKNNK